MIAVAGATALAFALSGAPLLLEAVIATSGVNFEPVSESAALDTHILSVNSLRLFLVLGTFGWLALRDGAILGPLKHIRLYLVFVAFGFVSLLWSPDRVEGMRLGLKLVFPLVVFALAADLTRLNGPTFLRKSFVVGACIGTLLNLAAAFLGPPPNETIAADRYTGTLAPNPLGLFSAIAALAIYAWFRTGRSKALFVLILALVAQLAATGSRTGAIALGIGLITFELLRGRWRATLLIAACSAAIWLTVPNLGSRSAVSDDDLNLLGTPSALEGVNLSGRLLIWGDVWTTMVQGERPWGNGIGATTVFLASRYSTIRSTHNEYLRLIAELGPIGLGLFVCSFLLLLRKLLRAAFTGSQREAAHLAIAATAAFLGASFMENTLESYTYFAAILWALVGIALATTPGPPEQAAGPESP